MDSTCTVPRTCRASRTGQVGFHCSMLASLLALLLLWLTGHAAPAMAADNEERLAYRSNDVADPMDPLADIIADDKVSWRAAVALLADPVETRLARSFDIQVATLVASFQFDGYVLQGHAMPWRKGDKDKPPSRLQETQPGVLVFRNDHWRRSNWRQKDKGEPAVEYFVVFLVGESPVFGVQRHAFCLALLRARGLNAKIQRPQPGETDRCERAGAPPAPASANERPKVKDTGKTPPTLEQKPEPEREAESESEADSGSSTASADNLDNPVPVLGPMFSGSMTSIGEMALRTGLHLRLLSPSATVDSNFRLTENDAAHGLLSYSSYASWQQERQLQIAFEYLYKKHGICPHSVVILAELSSFGQGAKAAHLSKDDGRDKACKRKPATLLQFPQNIAAIRSEHAKLAARKKGDTSLSLVPSRNLELDMQDAGDSLDLPHVYDPSLSSRSDELSLQQLMDTLSVRARPEAVLIVATDVRDRLYMLDLVRESLPAAMPVVLEGDHLLAHPDYRDANRGVLMVPHSRLQLCYRRADLEHPWSEQPECMKGTDAQDTIFSRMSFPTDYASSLFRATRALVANEPAPKADQEGPKINRMSVITLAGMQYVDLSDNLKGLEKGGSSGALIASDWRILSANFLLPPLWGASFLLVVASLWLWRSSRPGRAILPPMRHALRELEWWLRDFSAVCFKGWRRTWRRLKAAKGWPRNRRRGKMTKRWPTTRRRLKADKRGDVAPWVLMVMMFALSVVLFAALMVDWVNVLSVARSSALRPGDANSVPYGFHAYLRLVHGRDIGMAVILAGFYLWFVLLAFVRVTAWNQRCRMHWNFGADHPERNPHAMRGFHASALMAALLFSVPPLLAWSARMPTTVDDTVLTTLISFSVLVACIYFLVQAFLQSHRLCCLGRDVRLHALDAMPSNQLPAGWPSPRHLRAAPSSPLAVVFGESDWHELEAGGATWPRPPPPHPVNPWTSQLDKREIGHWCARTVAEFKFGLVCVRSCLAAAFIGPIAVLGMIKVHPFAFEWEQSMLALGMMLLALAASVYVTFRAEQATLIGQMFTQDGARVSFGDVARELAGKVVLALGIIAATMSPDLGSSFQSIMSMFKF